MAKVAVFVWAGALASMRGMWISVRAGVVVLGMVALSFVGVSKTATMTSPATDSTSTSCVKNERDPAIGLFIVSFQSLYAMALYISDLYHTF
jgi:hypothetical protein